MPNLAKGYTDNDRLLDAVDWPAERPSGALLSTVLDLAKWEAVLHTNKILSDASRQQMCMRDNQSIALGVAALYLPASVPAMARVPNR